MKAASDIDKYLIQNQGKQAHPTLKPGIRKVKKKTTCYKILFLFVHFLLRPAISSFINTFYLYKVKKKLFH